MLIHPDNKPASGPRKQTAEAVGRAMSRFPLVVEVLGKLGDSTVPLAGDAEIQHGCRRALTAMLVELSRIEPAAIGKPVKQEQMIMDWLHTREAAQLIDADQLERFQHFLDRIFQPTKRLE
jgi:hypothetical protein